MKQRAILKNKTYLYLTEFFSGMSVMAVELGASRLLAPYFSSSQIVWTIIIGTIMIAMALGNIYGGRSADKNPDPDRLYTRILIAALWIGLIPVAGKYIIIGITGVMIFAIDTNLLIAAAFAACMVIFVFPLFLLGTVTPSLAKYTMDSLGDSGKVVGMLNAANTIGSIIGTFVPTFVTIPAVGTAVTFLIFAGILLALAAAYFLSAGIGKGKTIVSCVIRSLISSISRTSSASGVLRNRSMTRSASSSEVSVACRYRISAYRQSAIASYHLSSTVSYASSRFLAYSSSTICFRALRQSFSISAALSDFFVSIIIARRLSSSSSCRSGLPRPCSLLDSVSYPRPTNSPAINA